MLSASRPSRGAVAAPAFPRFPDAPPIEPAPVPEMNGPIGLRDSRGPSTLSLTGSSLWIALGIAASLVVLTWVVAYQSGAKHEQARLLGPKQAPPPDGAVDGKTGLQPTDRTPKTPTPRTSPIDGAGTAAKPKTPAAPPAQQEQTSAVFGDDPREVGVNYLVIERLLLKDAQAAAAFLSQNGVPAVVVAPEGEEAASLLAKPRSLWCVIARQGLTSDEYKRGAERQGLIAKVQQIGRRWKTEQKGSSDFASCGWDKYNK